MTLMKHVANAGIAVDGGASRLFAIRLLCCVAASCIFLSAEAVVATNYVDCKLADYTGHDGSSWQKAFKTIQEGVDAANSGDVVLVAAGDYSEGGAKNTVSNVGLSNRVLIVRKAITLKSVAGAKATRIIGQYDSETAFPSFPGLGENAVRCLCVVANSASEAPVVEGFTFANGATAATNDGAEMVNNTGGGVMVCDTSASASSNCDIVDCIITNCIASRGGGMDGGRAFRCRLEDCDVYKANSSAARHTFLYSCLVVHNGRRNPSAGTVEYVFSGFIANCTFAGNAGAALGYYPGLVFNCLFSENGSTSLGKNDGTAYTNCLVDANRNIPSGFNTCIKPADNFQLFAPATGDYRLLPTSAAVQAGDVSMLAKIPAEYSDKDLDGNPRTTGGTVNIGCYETVAPAPEGGALVFNFKATVNGFTGYCEKLHAYSASYPETFDVSLAPGAYTGDTIYFGGDGGLVDYKTRWFPKWDDDRVGILAPTSSYIAITRAVAEQTLWVQDGYAGGDSNGTSQKPYTTIQDAVTAAGTAKTVIKVRPGVYATGGVATASGHADGSMQMNRVATAGNQNLRIVSTDGPSATTILGWSDPDGNEWGCSSNSYRCVYMRPSSVSYPQTLQGFTLSGGRAAYYAGGAYMNSVCGLLADCIITNCIAARGAAVYVGRLERCWVVDNFFSNDYKGSSYTYNDIVEQGVYSSCVFSANRSPDQLSTHPIVGMAGTMLHCSGIDNGNSKMTDSNVIQLNCIWDSFRNVAGSGSGGGGGDFAVNVGSISSNGNKEFTAIDSPLSRALPYCRAYASSPAVYGGSADITNHFKYSMLDYEGKVIRFKDGKPTAGAFQDPAAGAIATTDGTSGGISPAGETAAGLVPGDVVTFSATKARQRPFIGLRVDGELLEGVSSYDWTVPATPCYSPLRIEAVYGTNWYVNAESGDDSRLGSSWGEARRTLEGVMTNAVSGDVVTAAPGRYDTGSMMHSPLVYGSTSVRSRVVVPQGVTLCSSDGAENTFIVGANASVPEDEYGNGEDAIRGVFLNTGARLCGFTVTGGRTAVSNTSDGDHGRGGGVYCRGEGGIYVEDCIISNNVALRGAGVYMGVHKRCRILHNHALVNGAAFRNAYLSDCLVDYNSNPSGNGGVGYICWAFVNSIFGAHNADGNGSGVLFGFTAGKTTSNELIPMVNSVILAGAVQNFGFASNTLYTSAAGFSAMATPIGDTCTRVAADDLQFDAMGHPVYGHCVAIDAGDASLRDASYGDLDADGGQRVYNGKIDAGCCEFDWRTVYARIIGGTRAEVGAASPEVVRRADGHAVSLVDGTSVDVTLAARRPGLLRYELKVKVYGEGTLTVVRDGESLRTFTAQGREEIFAYDSSDAAQSLTFAFAGAGSADILSCRSPSGMRFLLR